MVTRLEIRYVENNTHKTVKYGFEDINHNPEHSQKLQGIVEFAKNKKIHFPNE